MDIKTQNINQLNYMDNFITFYDLTSSIEWVKELGVFLFKLKKKNMYIFLAASHTSIFVADSGEFESFTDIRLKWQQANNLW